MTLASFSTMFDIKNVMYYFQQACGAGGCSLATGITCVITSCYDDDDDGSIECPTSDENYYNYVFNGNVVNQNWYCNTAFDPTTCSTGNTLVLENNCFDVPTDVSYNALCML
jgi:hypothetical protein